MRAIALILGLAMVMVGCGQKSETADGAKTGEAEKPAAAENAEKAAEKAEPEKAGHPIWSDLDLAAELTHLEGDWAVKTAFGRAKAERWQIKGDKVTITKPDGETQLGKLSMPMPGQIGVKVGDMTSYYGYARDADSVRIGLGNGGVKTAKNYYVGASRGVVSFDGTRCAYHDKKMSFGGPVTFEDPVDVKCEVQEGGGKAVLHYQVPKFMKEGEFDDKTVNVKGSALFNDQLGGNVVAKYEAPAAAPAGDAPAKAE